MKDVDLLKYHMNIFIEQLQYKDENPKNNLEILFNHPVKTIYGLCLIINIVLNMIQL